MLLQTAQERQTSGLKCWHWRLRSATALPRAHRIPGDVAVRCPPTAAPYRARQKQHCGNCSKGRDSLPRGFLTGVFCTARKSISWCTSLQARGDRIQGHSTHSSLPGLCWALCFLGEGEQALLMFPPAQRLLLQTAINGKSLHSCAKPKPLPHRLPDFPRSAPKHCQCFSLPVRLKLYTYKFNLPQRYLKASGFNCNIYF